jgi:NlpC/P60 family protein
MEEHFQFARADGHPDWTLGQTDFSQIWVWARDQLRFHRGQRFDVNTRGDHPEHEQRPLDQLDELLETRLNRLPEDSVVEVTSILDKFTLLFRKHAVEGGKNDQLIDVIARMEGTPYKLGAVDCSGLVKTAVEDVTGIDLPHKAVLQRDDRRLVKIPRDELLKGDLVFITDEHVATWLGETPPGFPAGDLVWDTEPHDTRSPAGWPRANLGTGVQIRPAFGNYYCAKFDECRRIPGLNGA